MDTRKSALCIVKKSLKNSTYASAFISLVLMGFPGGTVVKGPPANAGDPGSISGPGRSPGEKNGYPLQCSCLENPTDRGSWQAALHGIAELDMTEHARAHCFYLICSYDPLNAFYDFSNFGISVDCCSFCYVVFVIFISKCL